MEIYNESVIDLINYSHQPRDKRQLPVRLHTPDRPSYALDAKL